MYCPDCLRMKGMATDYARIGSIAGTENDASLLRDGEASVFDPQSEGPTA